VPRQLLENGPARRIGQGPEHVIGIGCCHTKTITMWLCVVKKNVKIFDCGLGGMAVAHGAKAGGNRTGAPRQGRITVTSSVRGACLSIPGVATAVCSAKSRRDDLIIAQYGSAHTSCTQLEQRYSAEQVLGTMGRSHRQGCSIVEIGFLEVDPREFPAIARVFLAAGIWGLFGQHFPTGEDGGLYSCSGQASRTG
jgi:hypothetical protein